MSLISTINNGACPLHTQSHIQVNKNDASIYSVQTKAADLIAADVISHSTPFRSLLKYVKLPNEKIHLALSLS